MMKMPPEYEALCKSIKERVEAENSGYVVEASCHDYLDKLQVKVFKGDKGITRSTPLPVTKYLGKPDRVDELVSMLGMEIRAWERGDTD